MIVAIDGPAGAGKTTVARDVARELGFRHVDTGAIYRAATLAALRAGVDLRDGPAVARILHSVRIGLEDNAVTLDGQDVATDIRSNDVTAAVSVVSAQPEVRDALVSLQRALADGDVVVEGRDIGSTIFPEAELKVFLTASLDERARRRALDLGCADTDDALAGARHSLAARDQADSTRSVSPLTRPDDAIVIDSTDRPVGEIVQLIAAAARRLRESAP